MSQVWNGKAQTLAGWSRDTGIGRLTLRRRIESGWTVEEAMTTPVGVRRTLCRA